jgi:hypothetical protein
VHEGGTAAAPGTKPQPSSFGFHNEDREGAQREQTRAYLTDRGVSEETARYLCATLIGATFEAWMQWAAGRDPNPAPSLQRALRVLRIG